MGCGSFGVTPVLVGLYRVGIVGLRDGLKSVEESGLEDREAIVDQIIENLAADNYMPESLTLDLRTAMWREYLRMRGVDFSEFYSRVEVTVHGDAGAQRDQFVAMLESVFAEYELGPVIAYAEPGVGANPQLVVGDQTIVCGNQGRKIFSAAVRKSLTDW